MSTRKQVTTKLTAKEELAQLRKRLLNKQPTEASEFNATAVIGVGLDVVDHTREKLVNAVAGDDNVFTKINVARMKAKEARGGYH